MLHVYFQTALQCSQVAQSFAVANNELSPPAYSIKPSTSEAATPTLPPTSKNLRVKYKGIRTLGSSAILSKDLLTGDMVVINDVNLKPKAELNKNQNTESSDPSESYAEAKKQVKRMVQSLPKHDHLLNALQVISRKGCVSLTY